MKWVRLSAKCVAVLALGVGVSQSFLGNQENAALAILLASLVMWASYEL